MKTRAECFATLVPDAPAFRWRQVEGALFNVEWNGWSDATTLPVSLREIVKEIPWITVKQLFLQESAKHDTFKALLGVEGDEMIESVLMKNARGDWTICVSSQVGCAMRCGFCATGAMGLKRSLTTDEIVDQYRYWQQFLRTHPDLSPRISNVVFMGMGEPLANYTAVRETLQTWLRQTDLGLTRMTVSTVGVLPRLEQLLTDTEWPHVRLAVSLHSAIPETRKQIVPTSYDDFLPKLEDWARRYLQIFGNRRHHLTFEYVMLKGVNDMPEQAMALARYVKRIGNVRVNVIPYNFTGIAFTTSPSAHVEAFMKILEDQGVIVMRRRTMGDDIAAACGQLATKAE